LFALSKLRKVTKSEESGISAQKNNPNLACFTKTEALYNDVTETTKYTHKLGKKALS
jgi:hypothetical protein